MEDQAAWIAYAVSNVASILFLWAAIKQPRLARLLFFLLFGWASWFNFTTAHQQPEVYMMYAGHSISLYEQFINGWFKAHITGFVSLIAVGQGLIAILMLFRGWWLKLGCLGSIIFLLGIAPLGLYAGFPFSITMSIAAFFLFRQAGTDFLWRSAARKFPRSTPAQHLKPGP